MQKLTRLYQNKVTVDVAEKGWCLISYGNTPVRDTVWGAGLCLVFYSCSPEPDETFPDEAFARKLEQLILKQPLGVVWITNPKDEQYLWNMTTAFCRYSHIKAGNYWLHFQNKLSESDDSIAFSGIFGVNDDAVPLAEDRITLDLSDQYGALSFTLTPDPDEFRRLDAGMRYLRLLPEETEDVWKQGLTEQIHMRVLSTREKINMPARITPAALNQAQQSWFSLGENVFDCTFLSPEGEGTVLVSQNAKLVFERTAFAVSKDAKNQSYLPVGAEWYLGIDGSFSVQNGTVLMPGWAGTEFISKLSALRFVAGQSALLVTNEGTVAVETKEKRISTAWISVQGTREEKAEYYSAPVSMPFFEVKESAGDRCFFSPYSAKAAEYTETPSPAFPALAWSGLNFVPETIRPPMIEDGISDMRYQILTGEMDNTCLQNEAEKHLVAPCGLCVGVPPKSGTWNWVGIAQTADSGVPNVKLMNPSLLTRKALQQTKCLLMAATKEEFLSLSENQIQFEFVIDGWKIQFSENSWNENSLLMIKYTDEVTVRSLLAGTHQLEHLLSIAHDSKGNVKKGFEPVIDLLDRKEFQGILLLGGIVETDSLLPELQTVLKWGGTSTLDMVYTVISNGKITLNGSDISVAKSNIDALVLYEGTPEAKTDSCPFDFCTREMVTVIKQTKVNYFQSRSELSLYELFGTKWYTDGNFDGNELMLVGRLETAGAVSSYRFSLEAERTYKTNDSVLDSFEVKSLLLSGDNNEIAFRISGTQTYQNLEALDLFSYDEVGFDGITLIKNESASYVDYSSYCFIPETSAIRDHSFVKEFGAVITEVKAGVTGQTPDSLGFSSINTPIRQGTPGDCWNGMIWTIPLNSSGPLGKNEALSMELLAAWTGADYYIGIRTGGIFGKKFSLQGILTAGFHGITLEKTEETENGRSGMFFKLHGFSLKALGYTFPGKGVDVAVMGEDGKIAWYAAYKDGGGESGS